MHLYRYFFLIFILFSCKTPSASSQKISRQANNYCPESGYCNREVLNKSELKIQSDTFGKIYYEIVPGNNTVIRFTFKKDAPEGTADGNYSEIVLLEIPNKKIRLNLHDQELQQVKLLFGRLCFCRDATGYFKVENGSLLLDRTDKNIHIELSFDVKKVPQLLKSINENIPGQ